MDDNSIYERLKQRSDIPEEYFSYKLSDYNCYAKDKSIDPKKAKALKKIVKYCDNFDENFKNGKGLYIYGPAKSHLGITLLGTFVLRKALNNKKKCKFVEFPTFILNIADYSDQEKISQANEYYDADFLMIDSINAFQYLSTSMIKTTFANLISQRRRFKKPTIFSSHNDPETLALAYCDTLDNYIESYCELIDLNISNVPRMTLSEARHKLEDFSRRDPGREWQKYTIVEIARILLNK